MAAPVPVLGASGWDSSPAGKADALLSYYFLTDVSQSILYRGNLLSLPSHIQKYGHDETLLRTSVARDLETFFSRYFDSAKVEASTAKPNPADPNRINLTIYVEVVQDDVTYSLGRLINITDAKVRQIIDLNNQGEAAFPT